MKIKNPVPPVYQRFFIPSRLALVAMTLGVTSLAMIGVPSPVRAQVDVSVNVQEDAGGNSYRLFYDKLGDQGDWIATQQYGYVFQPHAVNARHGWRPYTDGYWAQTNSGWTWISNEDFGWATYHYGRWANVVDAGWVWVPGGEWSPGNVSWRVSRDHRHVGWAPLPPEARLERSEEIGGWVDTAYDIGPENYVFIDTNRFGETSYVTHVVPVEQNVTIITETENVTRVSYREVDTRQVVYNGGPEVTIINESIGRPVRQFDLDLQPRDAGYFQHQDYRGINAINGNQLVVATATREVITSNAIRVSEPPRIARRLDVVQVDRGYRGLGNPQEIERVRTQLRTQSPPPPPQVEQRATAALRKNGTVVPPPQPANAVGAAAVNPPPGAPEHNRPGNVPPVPATPTNAAAGVPPSAPGLPNGRPVAPPAIKPGTEVAPPKPAAALPAPEREKREAGAPVPEARATPLQGVHPSATPVTAAPKPRPINPERPETAAPGPKGENEPPSARLHAPSPVPHSEVKPSPAAERPEKPAAERPEAPAATPHHQGEPPHPATANPGEPAAPKPVEHNKPPGEPAAPKPAEHNKPPGAPEPAEHREPAAPKPEAAPGQHKEPAPAHEPAEKKAEPAQHKEPAAEKEPAEKKPAASKPEGESAHRNPEEGHGAEHASGGAKPEHEQKGKEKAESEDKKPTPKL